ncbi:hypothetical protein IGB31_14220 [Pseudomonas putida]|nr:hypothetical protein IGB31_14220 [Pseudomonas putida]
MNEQKILTPLSKSEYEAISSSNPTNIPYEHLDFERLGKDSSSEEIPESAFYYGEEPEQTIEIKTEPAKRKLNWSFLLACFFGMSTMALLIHIVGL